MKLTREVSSANLVRAWDEGRVCVGEEWLKGHLILTAEQIIRDWPVTHPERLRLSDLEPAIALAPEIIILGTGALLQFPDMTLAAALAEQRIGLEIMDTPAACRTYNVLVHEERRVAAALFNDARK